MYKYPAVINYFERVKSTPFIFLIDDIYIFWSVKNADKWDNDDMTSEAYLKQEFVLLG